MLLSQLVTPQLVRVPIAGADKAAVIRELVGVLAQNGGGDFNDILKAVEDREAVLSTGIGYGVAVPHGKSPTAERLRMVAGSSPTPIPFGAIDGLPVQLFFLLVGPESASTDHVRALSRISRLVRREPLREQLIAARDAAEFHRVLSAAETT